MGKEELGCEYLRFGSSNAPVTLIDNALLRGSETSGTNRRPQGTTERAEAVRVTRS